jgi:hypothetical protein
MMLHESGNGASRQIEDGLLSSPFRGSADVIWLSVSITACDPKSSLVPITLHVPSRISLALFEVNCLRRITESCRQH